jgi:hypothetical protein
METIIYMKNVITLWKATTFEEAHKLAWEEARTYAAEAKCIFLERSDAFHLFDDKIMVGTELYSTMRGSNFKPEQYISTFIETKRDRIQKKI